ncbi:MAG: hypothetical protein OXG88_05340 [Gammaproteobacteria bacterium]|nr:hypothetical protein [Gammaproteobacteria bacterium]
MCLSNYFPRLDASNHTITSPQSSEYNCIAWAAGRHPQDEEWWWPVPEDEPQLFWPDGVSRVVSIESFVNAFTTLGYRECVSGEFEEDLEKVALYAIDDRPTHMARQLDDGSWTSKLGELEDICHKTLDLLEGDYYGRVQVFMCRPRCK